MQETMHSDNRSSTSDNAGEQAAYSVLVGLIQHLDNQILSSQRFHVALLSTIPPVMAYFVVQRAGWHVVVGFGIIAIALAGHWASVATKLTLQKLCWTKELRELESALFPAGYGPFTRQKVFFDELSVHEIGWFDRLLLYGKKSKATSANVVNLWDKKSARGEKTKPQKKTA